MFFTPFLLRIISGTALFLLKFVAGWQDVTVASQGTASRFVPARWGSKHVPFWRSNPDDFWCSKVPFFSYKMRTKTNIIRKLKHEVHVKTHDNNTHYFFNSCWSESNLQALNRHRRFQPFLALSARASEEDFTLIKLRMIKYSAVGRKAKTTWQVMSAQIFPGKSGRGTEISIQENMATHRSQLLQSKYIKIPPCFPCPRQPLCFLRALRAMVAKTPVKMRSLAMMAPLPPLPPIMVQVENGCISVSPYISNISSLHFVWQFCTEPWLWEKR